MLTAWKVSKAVMVRKRNVGLATMICKDSLMFMMTSQNDEAQARR
jgi:hypothetical protein